MNLDLEPPEKPKPDDWRRYLPDVYWSLRVRVGFTSSRESAIANLGSRAGLQGKAPLAGRVSAIGRLELGVNVVNQNPKFVIGPGGKSSSDRERIWSLRGSASSGSRPRSAHSATASSGASTAGSPAPQTTSGLSGARRTALSRSETEASLGRGGRSRR